MSDHSNRMGKQDKVTRMHVVDLAPLTEDATAVDSLLQRITQLWSTIYDEMEPEETLWIFVPNTYQEGVCWSVPMAIADRARANTGLILKNIVTRHQEFCSNGDMDNSYEEILFFVKDKRAYRFNKDAIRVAHVYKGNEWGGEREKGNSAYHDTEVRRYNPEGKDPGNVWLNEHRDQTSDETVDETKPLSRTEALRRCLRAGSEEDEEVTLWTANDEFHETVISENREIRHQSIARVVDK